MKKINRVLEFVLPIFIIAMFMVSTIGPSVRAVDTVGEFLSNIFNGWMGIGGSSSSSSTSSSSSSGGDSNWEFPETGQVDSQVQEITDKFWGTFLTIAQILAFAVIIFTGVRYMFAAADQKADIKRGLLYLTIGAILVFATSTVVKIIVASVPKV